MGGELLRDDGAWRVIRATDAPLPEVHRVVCNHHAREFSELSPAHRAAMMETVAEVEADLLRRLGPDKINLVSLGNRVAHVHWHVIPRFRTDPYWPDSLWSARRPATEQALKTKPLLAALPIQDGDERHRLVIDGWDKLKTDASSVRTQVFVQEQGVPPEDEWETADAWARHAVVWASTPATQGAGLQPIATGRLLSMGPGPVAKIGRMAVLRPWRGQGLGQAVLMALVCEARTLGFSECLLHAQVSAAAFYARQGFVPEGDVFSEAGIAHQRMRLALAR